MDITPVFASFMSILEESTAAREREGKTFKTLSEDTICFFMAAGFLQHQVNPNSIEMEVRHPVLAPESETAVDIYVRHPDGPIWIEVKFDKTPSDTCFGNLLNDIYRLALIQQGKSFMLYVAAGEAYLERNAPRFLSKHRILLGEEFVAQLRKYAKKSLKQKLILKLEGKVVAVELLCREENRSLACLLYEVSVQA